MRTQHGIHQAYALDGDSAPDDDNDSTEERGLDVASDENFHGEDDDVRGELNLFLSI